ncbi:hypothetical protein ACVCAH_25465 [Micromonospora sp. LZ34]
MDTPALTPRVLVIGLDPYRVPGPWDPKPVADGIDVGRTRFTEHGVGAEFCLFGLDGSDDIDAVVTAPLRAQLGNASSSVAVSAVSWNCSNAW